MKMQMMRSLRWDAFLSQKILVFASAYHPKPNVYLETLETKHVGESEL
jgi:hypothetical protein